MNRKTIAATTMLGLSSLGWCTASSAQERMVDNGLESSSVRQGARIGSDGEVRALILAADKVIDF
jgi:hypothetical protein